MHATLIDKMLSGSHLAEELLGDMFANCLCGAVEVAVLE